MHFSIVTIPKRQVRVQAPVAESVGCELCSMLLIKRQEALSFTYLLLLYLRRHSPGAGWAGITNRVDHVSDGSTPGSAVLCELTRHVHPILSQSCVAEDSRSGDRFQDGLDRGNPCLQLASRSSAPHARRCGSKRVWTARDFGLQALLLSVHKSELSIVLWSGGGRYKRMTTCLHHSAVGFEKK